MTNQERRLMLTPGYAIGKDSHTAYDMGRNDGLMHATQMLRDLIKYDTAMSDIEAAQLRNYIHMILTRGAYGKRVIDNMNLEHINAGQE
jgi:hypothetical protein